MPIEQRASLPFADNFAVNVQIRITASQGGYDAAIQSDWGKWQRFPIGLKQQDVVSLSADLRQSIEQASAAFDIATTGSTLSQSAISRLAEKGSFAFKSMFTDSAVRQTLSDMLRSTATIQVTSEEFLVPWELLYDGPIGSGVDVSRFWGMQHVISRALIQNDRPGDYVSPIMHTASPRVGMAACRDLEHVVKHEIPTLENLHQQNQLILLLLRALNPQRYQADLLEFGQFLGSDIEIAHFACHAVEGTPSSQSYLLFSDQFPITIRDFTVYDFELRHNPFVLLNACRTGTMNPLSAWNWAALFWERGARGVLATEFRVPDSFAAAFIEQVYSHLLAGIPIGTSLLKVRQYFWQEKSNPLGLAYALYSSPSIRIAR